MFELPQLESPLPVLPKLELFLQTFLLEMPMFELSLHELPFLEFSLRELPKLTVQAEFPYQVQETAAVSCAQAQYSMVTAAMR